MEQIWGTIKVLEVLQKHFQESAEYIHIPSREDGGGALEYAIAVGPSKKVANSDFSLPTNASFVSLFFVTLMFEPELNDLTLKSVISCIDIPR